MIPLTEFRLLGVDRDEPGDRTVAGTVAGDGSVLDLGAVDTTDEPQNVPVRALWWRVTDLRGNSAVTNMRVWLSSTAGYTGGDAWYLHISDEWRRGITPVAVAAGSPGAAPLTVPAPNLARMGGGDITGTGHGQTSQYIYLSGRIGINESTGEKTGLVLAVTFDYH